MHTPILCGTPCPHHTHHTCARSITHCGPHRDRKQQGTETCSWAQEEKKKQEVRLISFGHLHGPAPTAHLVFDLRTHFRDPHPDPAVRHLSSPHPKVRAQVETTPGIPELVDAITTMVLTMTGGPGSAAVVVAVGCSGGKHRAPTVADMVVDLLQELDGFDVEVEHRHRDLPVPVSVQIQDALGNLMIGEQVRVHTRQDSVTGTVAEVGDHSIWLYDHDSEDTHHDQDWRAFRRSVIGLELVAPPKGWTYTEVEEAVGCPQGRARTIR